MAVGEFELIQQYFVRLNTGRGVAMGIGDDCAILAVPEGKQLAVSMDTLVAGVHFPKNADPEKIAERALRVNLSDLAAMGAEPLWFTLGLTLPESDPNWLNGFSQGLFQVADKYNCALVGGDTTRGPLSITIQVHGALDVGAGLMRSGASVGDLVLVTGPLGDAAAALAVIKGELEVGEQAFRYFMDSFYRPEPKLQQGKLLAGIASAALDISDGLIADLGHICEQSMVGATIDIDRLPLSDAMKKRADPVQAIMWALGGGDDYQLCFTVPQDNFRELEALMERGKIDATVVGEIVSGDKVTCLKDGKPVSLPSKGYNHFSA